MSTSDINVALWIWSLVTGIGGLAAFLIYYARR